MPGSDKTQGQGSFGPFTGGLNLTPTGEPRVLRYFERVSVATFFLIVAEIGSISLFVASCQKLFVACCQIAPILDIKPLY